MSETDYAETVTNNNYKEEFIRRAYGKANNPHDSETMVFRITATNFAEACRMIEAIGRFNNFRPERVTLALERCKGLEIMVGREYSPVIYIGTLYQLEDFEKEVITKAFVTAGADEADNVENGEYLRFWWD